MEHEHDATQRLLALEARIDWVLTHAAASDWLKEGLRAARERDPVEVLNDLAMLETLLRPRSEALIERAVRTPDGPPTGSEGR